MTLCTPSLPSARAPFRAKVDGFVPHTQHVNLRIVGQSTRARQSYTGTSLIRNSAPLGTYSRKMPRALWRPEGVGLFFMSEVSL